MASDPTWKLPLPNPEDPQDDTSTNDLGDKVDMLLMEVVDQVDARYATHGIEALPTKTTRQAPDGTESVVYALYLSFTSRNNFSYRLFELTSHQVNGGLPVTVQAFSGPPVDLGKAETADELQGIIDKIFKDNRTRWVINAYYKP